IVLEPKLDGVAVSIIYVEGIIDSVSLRGNGYMGEDVTHLAPYIKNLLMEIPNNYHFFAIRGEIIDPKNLIKENNRNYVSGCLRRKEAADFGLELLPYKIIVENNINNSEFNTQESCLIYLSKLMKIPYYRIINQNDDYLNLIEEFRKEEFDFYYDGIVFKINDIEKGEALGITNRYPRNSIAYKFSEKSQITKIVKIEWSLNRRGFVIPTCILEPININGSNISKVNGYNKRYIENNQLGVGSLVNISRVGDVIPQIATIIEAKGFEKLIKCPVCKETLKENEVNYFCENKECSGKLFQNILYFFEKLKVDGISHNIISKFFLQNIKDLDLIIKEIERKTWPTSKHDWNVFYNWQKV
ncbi:MAG: hypothetical protein ACK5XN_25395, partial [Bacteroidota bacterium]